MIILGIEIPESKYKLEYPYYLIREDETVKSCKKLSTALIELAALIDEYIEKADKVDTSKFKAS